MTDSLQPGTDVEVRSTFERGWARGFVIEGACDEGYHLRRRSDNAVLPATFPAEAVRAAPADPPAFPC